MEAHTLAFYSLSAGLCFSLGMVLVAYAQLQRGTLLVRSAAFALLVLALAFFFAGYGALLPTWTTRIGTNVLLLFANVVLYSGLVAYLENRPLQLDRPGTLLVVLTFPLFYWWGLVAPDGQMRSAVFSAVAALLDARITKLLIPLARRNGGIPAKLLSGLFGIATLWMASRTVVLLLADPVPFTQQGSNPTSWVTVFWFNVLISGIVATLLLIEHRRTTARQAADDASLRGKGLDSSRSNLLLLWTMVTVIALTILTEVGIAYSVLYQRETRELQSRSQLANRAFVEHTEQIIREVDLLIHATRNLFERQVSPADLETFIEQLPFPRDLIENVYVIDAHGQIITPQADRAKGRNLSQRDYFLYHQQNTNDQLVVSQVSVGQITGKHQFRLSRRLFDKNGHFAGAIVAPLEPKSLTHLFERMLITDDAVATLLSDQDQKIRARMPPIENPANYDTPVDNTPLWRQLAAAPRGTYRNYSPVDGYERHYHYQRVGNTPLVMVTGFSLNDIHRRTLQSIQPIGLGALLALALVLLLAFILSRVIRKRDEQENFIAMLSHELKTPLSVIRMSVGRSTENAQGNARIQRAVREIQGVIDCSLQADRLHHGLIDTQLVSLDAAVLLQEIILEAELADRLQLKSSPLPPCNGDQQLFRAVIGNLIDNALKYGAPEQPVLLEMRATSHRKQPGIAIRVSNTVGSSGFPDPQQVFRKYYRAPAAHGKTGSGLGLHIAEGFARMMGGKLTYIPGKTDVCFELWIPCT